MFENEKKYVCVFDHNTEDSYFSKSNVEFLDGRLKFSILKLIGKEHQINGMYEFKLEYPEIDKDITWRQEKRPQDASNASPGKVTIIKDDFEQDQVDSAFTFKGLRKSDQSSYTLLDGTAEFWHFAIGQYAKWPDGIIAGPYGSKYTSLKAVRLWLRVPNIEKWKYKPVRNIHYILLFLLL